LAVVGDGGGAGGHGGAGGDAGEVGFGGEAGDEESAGAGDAEEGLVAVEGVADLGDAPFAGDGEGEEAEHAVGGGADDAAVELGAGEGGESGGGLFGGAGLGEAGGVEVAQGKVGAAFHLGYAEVSGGDFFLLAGDFGVGHEAAVAEGADGLEEGAFGVGVGAQGGELVFEVEALEGEFGGFEAFALLAGAGAVAFLAGEVLSELGGVEAGDAIALGDTGALGEDVDEHGGALHGDGDDGEVAGFEGAAEGDAGADVGAGDGKPVAGGGEGRGGAAGREEQEGGQQEGGDGGWTMAVHDGRSVPQNEASDNEGFSPRVESMR
jgi:hypothetical protein